LGQVAVAEDAPGVATEFPKAVTVTTGPNGAFFPFFFARAVEAASARQRHEAMRMARVTPPPYSIVLPVIWVFVASAADAEATRQGDAPSATARVRSRSPGW
jgi:hypothetical protein